MVARSCAAPAPRLLVLAALLLLLCAPGVAAKPRTRVGGDLDGVPDSEEDDAWREWGKCAEPKKIEGAGEGGCGLSAAVDALPPPARRAVAGGAEEGVQRGMFVSALKGGLRADARLPRAAATEHRERRPRTGQSAPRQRQGRSTVVE